MSYRCQGCDAVCHGSMKRHVARRPDGQIASEVPVCGTCLVRLDAGAPLAALRRNARPKQAKQPTREATVAKPVEPDYQSPTFGG